MGEHIHKILPQDVSPQEALKTLKEGNNRFINNLKANRNLKKRLNPLRPSFCQM